MRSLRLLPLLLAAGSLAAQQKLDRRIAIAPDASIRIWNLIGTTRIIGWDRDSIAVTATLPPGAGNFYMGGAGKGAKLGVEREDEVKDNQPATLEIRVPRAARLWVKSGSASIEASGLTGELEASSVDGSIRVEGSLKLVVAESMDGNINIAGPVSVVRIKGGGGTVTCRGARGDVHATTVGGAIVATDAALIRAHLETVSGVVSYDGTVAPQGTLEVITHSGDVTLRLPAEISAEFELNSIDGPIAFGPAGKGGSGKSTKGKVMSFSSGAGEARIQVRSFKGEIRVIRP